MTIHLNIPKDVAQKLKAQSGDLSRFAVESLALEGYRSRALRKNRSGVFWVWSRASRSMPFLRSMACRSTTA